MPGVFLFVHCSFFVVVVVDGPDVGENGPSAPARSFRDTCERRACAFVAASRPDLSTLESFIPRNGRTLSVFMRGPWTAAVPRHGARVFEPT